MGTGVGTGVFDGVGCGVGGGKVGRGAGVFVGNRVGVGGGAVGGPSCARSKTGTDKLAVPKRMKTKLTSRIAFDMILS